MRHLIVMYRIQISEIRPEPHVAGIRRCIPGRDSVMTALLLCMVMMCMKLLNLRIKCSVLISVI